MKKREFGSKEELPVEAHQPHDDLMYMETLVQRGKVVGKELESIERIFYMMSVDPYKTEAQLLVLFKGILATETHYLRRTHGE